MEIGYRFHDQEALERLFDTKLCGGAGSDTREFQRLEFFGDSVLKLAVDKILYDEFPGIVREEYNSIQQALNCGTTATMIANHYRLLDYFDVKIPQKQRATQGKNSLEALLGAIHLDANKAGSPATNVMEDVVRRLWKPYLDNLRQHYDGGPAEKQRSQAMRCAMDAVFAWRNEWREALLQNKEYYLQNPQMEKQFEKKDTFSISTIMSPVLQRDRLAWEVKLFVPLPPKPGDAVEKERFTACDANPTEALRAAAGAVLRFIGEHYHWQPPSTHITPGGLQSGIIQRDISA